MDGAQVAHFIGGVQFVVWGRHISRMGIEDEDASRVSGGQSGCCVIDSKNFACDIFCSIHFAIDDMQIADAWQHTGHNPCRLYTPAV